MCMRVFVYILCIIEYNAVFPSSTTIFSTTLTHTNAHEKKKPYQLTANCFICIAVKKHVSCSSKHRLNGTHTHTHTHSHTQAALQQSSLIQLELWTRCDLDFRVAHPLLRQFSHFCTTHFSPAYTYRIFCVLSYFKRINATGGISGAKLDNFTGNELSLQSLFG